MNKLIFFGAILFLISCGKDGAIGPEGPAGKDGTNGNANVVSSTLTSSAWTYNDPSWEISFTYEAITQDIIDHGAVLVYVGDGSTYIQLPVTFYFSSSYSSTLDFVTYVGGLKVRQADSDLTQPDNPGSMTFKIVVIAASTLKKGIEINLNDFEEVKKAFGLVD
jgi:hypothetical protein